MCAILISKVLKLARVNEGSQFYLPPTRLSTSGMSHSCIYSAAAEHHRTLVATISRPDCNDVLKSQDRMKAYESYK